VLSDELLRSMRKFVRSAYSAAELASLGSRDVTRLTAAAKWQHHSPAAALDDDAAPSPPPRPPSAPVAETPAGGWRLPSLVLIGAVGCESAALSEVLASHPRVFLPSVRTPPS